MDRLKTGISTFDDPPTTGQACRRSGTTEATAGERDECEKNKNYNNNEREGKKSKTKHTYTDSKYAAVSEVGMPLSVGGRYYHYYHCYHRHIIMAMVITQIHGLRRSKTMN